MRARGRVQALLRSPLLAARLAAGRYDFVYDQMPISLRGISWRGRANLLRSGMNLLHRRSRPWSRPLHMQFELTSVCNLRCPVCPTGIGELERNIRYMDADLFERVYAETAPYLLTASLWGWGEPLLHPRLRDILRTASRYPAVTFLSTNGARLGREPVIEALLEFPPTYLIVAVDGLSDETNARFRVGARLEPILAAVRELARLKRVDGRRLPILHMRFMVMEHNEHEVPRVEAFARDQGFDMLSLRTLALVDSERTLRAHQEMIPNSPDFRAYAYDGAERIRLSDYVCMQPFWFPSVYADGRVVSCEQDYNASQPSGSVADGRTFMEVWNGAAAARVRQTVRDRPQDYSFCRNCPSWDRTITDTSFRAVFFDPALSNPLVTRGDRHG